MSNPIFRLAAHDYVEKFGFSVFPLAPRTKRPIVAGGFKASTTNHDQIQSWWKANPDAGIGIATGATSGIVVLDQDPRNDGEQSYVELQRDHGHLADAPLCRTGGGGTHEYFQHPGDAPVPCRSNLGGYRGIDLKGDGGYVVAAPSVHPNGDQYIWDLVFGLEEVGIPPLPNALIKLARAGPQTTPESYEQNTWDGQLPDRVAYFCATRPLISRRFNRCHDGLLDPSPSGVDFSLSCLLARCGCDGQTIEAGIRASRERARLPLKRESYFQSTIGKAIRLAKEDHDRG